VNSICTLLEQDVHLASRFSGAEVRYCKCGRKFRDPGVNAERFTVTYFPGFSDGA